MSDLALANPQAPWNGTPQWFAPGLAIPAGSGTQSDPFLTMRVPSASGLPAEHVDLWGQSLQFFTDPIWLNDYWIMTGNRQGLDNLIGFSYNRKDETDPWEGPSHGGTLSGPTGSVVITSRGMRAEDTYPWSSSYLVFQTQIFAPDSGRGDNASHFRLHEITFDSVPNAALRFTWDACIMNYEGTACIRGGARNLVELNSYGSFYPLVDNRSELGAGWSRWARLSSVLGSFGDPTTIVGLLAARQTANGQTAILAQRATDVAPSGRLLQTVTAAVDAEVFSIDAAEPTPYQTVAILRYHNGTSIVTQYVGVGAANSESPGYRNLRVPN